MLVFLCLFLFLLLEFQVLTTDNYPHLRTANGPNSQLNTTGGDGTITSGGSDEGGSNKENGHDVEIGETPPITSTNTKEECSTNDSSSSNNGVGAIMVIEEDQLVVEIPTPGFQFAAKAAAAASVLGHSNKRQVPNLCRYVP
jgi:hypothetical protein